MEALKNLKLVEAAREEAFTLVKDNPDLSRFPYLKELALTTSESLHLE
jgi:hypothetical protein